MEKTNSDLLELLPFKVKRLFLRDNGNFRNYLEYILELENNQKIIMGKTSELLSPKQAYQRLFDEGYFLSKDALENWQQIAVALKLLVPKNNRF